MKYIKRTVLELSNNIERKEKLIKASNGIISEFLEYMSIYTDFKYKTIL